jgi:hypothetical protein
MWRGARIEEWDERLWEGDVRLGGLARVSLSVPILSCGEAIGDDESSEAIGGWRLGFSWRLMPFILPR